MATTAATPRARRYRTIRILRWVLIIFFPILVVVVAFALLRPLDVLWTAAEFRLFFQGIQSKYTPIPVPGVGNVRVHYYEGGSGMPVVLVHGLGGRADDWVNLIPQLARDHHHVYALDLPGYGRSEWPRNAKYSIAEEAADVEGFMSKMGLQQTDLAGWSMGGWVAMQVALNEPQRIRRLVIFDSAGLTFGLTWDPSLFVPDTPEKLQKLDDLLLPSGKAPGVPRFVQRAIFNFEKKHGWVVQRNMDSMLTGDDLLDNKLGALKMPMLIIWGKQDHLIPVSEGEAIHHAVPQSELQVFDGCGHLLPEQCAKQVAPVVKGFLDESSPMGGRKAVIGPKAK
ncbi:MAG TPA: alpha/beta hydrolase [Acidobacteriaceae bacterium]|nr:alpha/beta hydrolase [Acidobacteriaceae bacterium]